MGKGSVILGDVDTAGFIETTVECRLYAAPGMLSRVIHMESAPTLIRVHDDVSGLVSLYRLTDKTGDVAVFLFDRIV